MFTRISFIFVLIAITLPSGTQAYNPTNQTAHTIADTFAVFTMETSLSPNQDGFTVPVLGSVRSADDTFGFELFSDTSAVNVDKAVGFIVADAPKLNGYYQLPTDRTTTLTIVIIATPATDAPRQQLRARLTNLPFGVVPALNDNELSNYVTPKTTI